MSHQYTTLKKVSKEHLDDLKHVNNIQYLIWSQEVAKIHWEKIKGLISYTKGVWMVRNHEVNYRLGAFLGDFIRIETYVEEVRGPLSLRVVAFYNDKTDQLLVRCKTLWCWVELESRKPLKVTEEIKRLFLNEKTPY